MSPAQQGLDSRDAAAGHADLRLEVDIELAAFERASHVHLELQARQRVLAPLGVHEVRRERVLAGGARRDADGMRHEGVGVGGVARVERDARRPG